MWLVLAWGIGVLALFVVLYLLFMILTDYRPRQQVVLAVERNGTKKIGKGVPFSILSFNIGYCGLDADADFFMDGGSRSRSRSLEQTRINLERISTFLLATQADLLMLQEVDIRSSRSFGVDEKSHLQKNLPGYGSAFALNYKVPWVPVPLTRPMGAVLSGLLTFSRFAVGSAVRIQLPGRESWPRQLAELDRCLLETRLPVEGGRELVLIHLHLSVFDKGGRIRKLQLAYLKKRLLAELQQGNHVIVAGDWNHGLPGSDPRRFPATQPRPGWYMALPADFAPEGFAWALDASVPTVRSNGTPYRQGSNFAAVIDGFLVSSNVEIQRVNGHSLLFENSDHNPVTAVFVLK